MGDKGQSSEQRRRNQASSRWRVYARHFCEVLAVIGILICAVYSFQPSYVGQERVQLDHGKMNYQGRVAQNKFNGNGQLKINQVGTYVGQFVDGRFSGSGRFVSTQGWAYTGDFKNGAISGQGTITNTKQQVIGQFKNGTLKQP